MAHINKQIVDLKHKMEWLEMLQAEKKSLEHQIELKQAEISLVLSNDPSISHDEHLSISALFLRFNSKRKDAAEVERMRNVVLKKQKENDLEVLQNEYSHLIDQLKENKVIDKQYKKLMEEKRFMVQANQSEVFASLEAIIEKCRLDNSRMNETVQIGERLLAQLKEVYDTYFHSSKNKIFETNMQKNAKQYEKLNEMQVLIAQLKRTLDLFEVNCQHCSSAMQIDVSSDFIKISDKIVDGFLMDFFFDNEREKIQKEIHMIEKKIAVVLHDLDIRIRANQNKIIETLDCINAL